MQPHEIQQVETEHYSKNEEIVNWLTHGIATLLSVVGAIFIFKLLTSQAESNSIKWISAGVYTISLIVLYSASTLYHASRKIRWKNLFRVADHGAIYVKIAGTYTPFLLLAIPGYYGYELLIVLWLLALVGIIFKVFFVHRFNGLSTGVYLAMGWMALLVLRPLYLAVPLNVFVYIIVGGLCFSLGVIFYLIKKLPYSHSIWHVFVMGGSAFHFIGIYQYLSV